MNVLILNTRREAYGVSDIPETLTVKGLIELLSQYEDDTPVYLGNDKTDYGWYTYGSVNEWDFEEADIEEE